MKKLAFLLITFMFSSLTVAQPMRFEEGKHYTIISDKADSKPNVTEFFSFYCPHCYRFESIVTDIKKNLPDGVKFKKSHVDFMRTASPQTQQALSRAMVVGEKMGIKDKVVSAIFKHIHEDRKPFTSEADVLAIFSKIGADQDKATKMLNSFAIKGEANRMKKAQEELSRAQVLTAVPMFIVNGKYKLNGRELRSLNDYNDLIEYLVKLDK